MGCNAFVNEGNKERNSSLVPCCHLPLFSCVSLAVLFQEMKMKGGQRPPTSAPLCLTTGVHRFHTFHFLFCTDPQLTEKTTSWCFRTTPTSTTPKTTSRPPSFSRVNIQIYILPCETSRFLSSCRSLPPLPHFLLSQPPSLSPSLVVKIHPTAERLLFLWVCSHRQLSQSGHNLHSFTIPLFSSAVPLLAVKQCCSLLLQCIDINMIDWKLRGIQYPFVIFLKHFKQ